MSFLLVTRLLNSRICHFRTDSKRSLRPLPFLSREGNVLHDFFWCNFWVLTFIQNIGKRDFPFFRKVSFSYLCADERSKSANLLTCLLIKCQSALLTYFLSALFRILPVEFFGISSISMKCLGILYAAILPFMNFRISFSSSV